MSMYLERVNMYMPSEFKEQDKIDKEFIHKCGGVVSYLEDKCGGRAAIALDDHCYVLWIRQTKKWIRSSHWFGEVCELIKILPNPSRM